MRVRSVIASLTVAVVLAAVVQPAFAAENLVRLNDLIAYPASRSGETVVFEGEAIGQALRQPDGHVFVNVLDDGTAVGVYMTDQQSSGIIGYGGYKQIGTIVRVSGELNVACAQHGGDFDVHAAGVSVIEQPTARETEPLGLRLMLAPIALALGIGQFFLYRRLRSHRHLF
ncbi:MAG: hypothetical protein CVT67_05355 [Actinobacteria bacterium HGW-Actinobacteria-7]|jgi:hypothetical protein|nr:MAG: hypothetical protein CVT67_05355 [Actinobacteria bacterium HGW-Actinobacteria-7]